MRNGAMIYKGKRIRREVEILGDVELVRWFLCQPEILDNFLFGALDSEIYDQDKMIPVLPII